MQVPIIILAVAIEIYLALLIGAVILLLYSRKQKKLIRRQQEKLVQLINEIKKAPSSAPIPQKTYKHHINEQLDTTQQRFKQLAPNSDISGIEPGDVPLDQRVVALRYAFLRAEELGTIEEMGTDRYWALFQQTLEPLLPPTIGVNSGLDAAEPVDSDELETYKKRVENLEKFKKLFFDLEKQWNEAQANAQHYYMQLSEMAPEVVDKERFTSLLNDYHGVYDGLNHSIHNTNLALMGQPTDAKTINIIRHDPRAAEEIMKLRNVAADQYRVINNLQRKLEEAVTSEEKELIIEELEQQLQRQIRFVQESDTCVQLLEEELAKANEKIAEQEQLLDNEHLLDEENSRIKETLHSFTLESKDLLVNLDELEKENAALKNATKSVSLDTTSAKETTDQQSVELKEVKASFSALQKQYAELEEKYLELKFK